MALEKGKGEGKGKGGRGGVCDVRKGEGLEGEGEKIEPHLNGNKL